MKHNIHDKMVEALLELILWAVLIGLVTLIWKTIFS